MSEINRLLDLDDLTEDQWLFLESRLVYYVLSSNAELDVESSVWNLNRKTKIFPTPLEALKLKENKEYIWEVKKVLISILIIKEETIFSTKVITSIVDDTDSFLKLVNGNTKISDLDDFHEIIKRKETLEKMSLYKLFSYWKKEFSR